MKANKIEKIIIIVFILILGFTNIRAQSLNELLNDKSKNYKEITSELRKNDKYLKKASKEDRKMYERWRWFWDSRVDSTGSFEKYNTNE